MTTASINFTGRRKIARNQFNVSKVLDSDTVEDHDLAIWIDPKFLEKIEDTDVIVLDVVHRADHDRFVLKAIESQVVRPIHFSRGKNTRYRLSVVEGTNLGKIKTSTPEFKLVSQSDHYEEKSLYKPAVTMTEEKDVFFDLEESDDLGAMLWNIDFSDLGAIIIQINSRLVEIYNGNQKDPILRGFVLPAILRELFSGLFMRLDSIDDIIDEKSGKWFIWANSIMGEDCPNEGFIIGEHVSVVWLEWLDRLMLAFSNRKYIGPLTLLGAMEEHIND